MSSKWDDYIKKVYDKKALSYDRNTSAAYSKYGKLSSDDIYNYLLDKDFVSLLDIGSGTGYMLDKLSRKKIAIYYGIDISYNMLMEARGKNISGATFLDMNAIKLNFANESIDVITFSESFHCIKEYERVLSECYRVLKFGGVIIIGEHYPKRNPFEKLFGKIKDKGIYKYYKSEDIARLLTKYKFKILGTRTVDKETYTIVGQK